MNKSLVTASIMALFLVACASKSLKEETPVKVEEKPVTKQVPQQPQIPEVKEEVKNNQADVTPVIEQKTAVNPLKDPNNILSTRSVFFDYNSDEVKAEYRALVEAHANYLIQNPNAKLILQGNADDRGSREYNLALGQRRSVAVKKVMNLIGANDKQIETISYGEEKQRCTDKTEACWAQNRRADIVYEGE